MGDERLLCAVTVHRENGFWVEMVDDLHARATDVDHFVDPDEAVRDLVATFADLDPEGFDVERRFRQGESDLDDSVADLR